MPVHYATELTAKPSEWQQRTCTQYLLSACKVNGNNERAVWKGTQLCSFQPHQDDGFRQLLEEVAHSIPFLWTINPIFTTLPSMKPQPGLFFREAGDKSHLSITTHGNNLFNSPALMCQTYVCCFFQVGYSVSHTKCFLLPTFFHHFISFFMISSSFARSLYLCSFTRGRNGQNQQTNWRQQRKQKVFLSYPKEKWQISTRKNVLISFKCIPSRQAKWVQFTLKLHCYENLWRSLSSTN